MSKVTAPLLSFGASGQIAKTQVFGTWRGISYVRRHVVPANPRTADQTQTRTVFNYLNQVWKLMAAGAQAPWTAYATGKPLINRNAWIKFNLPNLRAAADNSSLDGSPGSGGGLPMSAFAAAGGVGTINVTFTAPAVPAGWSVTASHAFAYPSDDPHSATDFTSTYDTNAVAPYTVALAVDAGDYVVTGWIEYAKPDGSVAYSVGQTDAATAT
jgi:hypothetical protein